MYKNHTYLAIIPARGQSKRLIRKNERDLCGKPLLEWSVDAAKKSKYIDMTVVSTDDDDIFEITKNFGVDVLRRPVELASDTASSFDVVKHALAKYQDYDYVILLQPTSPLRDEIHIDEAIDFLEQKNADAVISICEMDHSPLWSLKLDKSLSISKTINNDIFNKRSQDLEKFYRLNGAIYLSKTDKLLKENSFFLKKNIFAYVMEKEASIDIDEKIDFELASLYMNEKLKHKI
jgi:CMP-N-acetylneuraminic acid synthetase